MKKPPPLQGKLKTHIQWRGPSTRQRMAFVLAEKPSEDEVQKHKLEEELGATYLLLEVLEKLPLLADRYGLKPNKDEQIPWLALLMKVCQEYIPGFRVKYGGKTRGSPKIWTPKRLVQLWADAEHLKAKKPRSDAQVSRETNQIMDAKIQNLKNPRLKFIKGIPHRSVKATLHRHVLSGAEN